MKEAFPQIIGAFPQNAGKSGSRLSAVPLKSSVLGFFIDLIKGAGNGILAWDGLPFLETLDLLG
jgi:hypothetical protein